jgi:hypothetical protein
MSRFTEVEVIPDEVIEHPRPPHETRGEGGTLVRQVADGGCCG